MAFLLVTSVARADDEPPPPPAPVAPIEPAPRGFAAGGLSLGGDHFINGAMFLEGGVALPGAVAWVHAVASLGGSLDFEGAGGYQRALGGVELRGCRHLGTCAFLDLDLGYQHQTWNGDGPDDHETHQGLVLGPRIGFDAGGGAGVHVRGALEIYAYRREATSTTASGTSVVWERGGALTLSLGYQL
ncbi:MAG TPA: hypothetical protein VFT22_03190 [Kofleriaceae bacterium]|nr:hypothetical protein [Kofleriaceae bacterium]